MCVPCPRLFLVFTAHACVPCDLFLNCVPRDMQSLRALSHGRHGSFRQPVQCSSRVAPALHIVISVDMTLHLCNLCVLHVCHVVLMTLVRVGPCMHLVPPDSI